MADNVIEKKTENKKSLFEIRYYDRGMIKKLFFAEDSKKAYDYAVIWCNQQNPSYRLMNVKEVLIPLVEEVLMMQKSALPEIKEVESKIPGPPVDVRTN